MVVMLDADCAFARPRRPTDVEIYWGAYLGTADELLVSGQLAEVADEIAARPRRGAGAQGLDHGHLPAAGGPPAGRSVLLVLGGHGGGARAGRRARTQRRTSLVISSLAGRVRARGCPPARSASAASAAADGLAGWLRRERVAAVVDATHPFARAISATAAGGLPAAGVPLLRLERPGWTRAPGDRWHWVDDLRGRGRRWSALGHARAPHHRPPGRSPRSRPGRGVVPGPLRRPARAAAAAAPRAAARPRPLHARRASSRSIDRHRDRPGRHQGQRRQRPPRSSTPPATRASR